jgi:hypothetical protein
MPDIPNLSGVPDWRRTAGYAYTVTLPRAAWAWEFLRRNSAYRQAWSVAAARVAMKSRASGLVVGGDGDVLAELVRWGVFFQ